MRVFGDIGKPAFRTAPDGQRLFYTFGPWSRPYIVPDPDTEDRLRANRWLLDGSLLVLAVVGQRLLQRYDPGTFTTVVGFFAFVACVWLGYQVMQHRIFHAELRDLAHAESRLSLHDYYADEADGRLVTYFVLNIAWALGFIGLGVWLLVSQSEPVIGWVIITIFAVTGAAWIYALALELAHHTPSDAPAVKA